MQTSQIPISPVVNRSRSRPNESGCVDHAKTGIGEATLFRVASRYEPVVEGLVRGYLSKNMLDEKNRIVGGGAKSLVHETARRLVETERGREKWAYTKRHSLEVADFAYIIASEAVLQKREKTGELIPDLCFYGGFVHDVGKTFLPMAIVDKESGIDMVFFSIMQGTTLTDVERRLLRDEHIFAGTRFVRLFGDGAHIKVMLDMVGLHHVMYNGCDTTCPSYPKLMKGYDLPFHSRIAKTADFLSAVLPRHYRSDMWVFSLQDAIGYALAVAGKELDPVTVSCVISGIYDTAPENADRLVARLAHPDGQEAISDFKGIRGYVRDVIQKDEEFLKVTKNQALEKLRRYKNDVVRLASEFGVNIPDGSGI